MSRYESKLTTCLHCCKKFWHGKFIRHIHQEHSQSLKEYKVCFPQAELDVGQYVCLICGAGLAHYSSPISGHLSSRHGLTVREYYQNYHQPNTEMSPADGKKFTCKICLTETECDYKSIKSHLDRHCLLHHQVESRSRPRCRCPRNRCHCRRRRRSWRRRRH